MNVSDLKDLRRLEAIACLKDIDSILRHYEFEIDCHAEFVSLMIDRKTEGREIVAVLYENLDPVFDFEEGVT